MKLLGQIILMAVLSVVIYSCGQKKLFTTDLVINSTTELQGSLDGTWQWVKNQCAYSVIVSEYVSEDVDYNQWKSKVTVLVGRSLEEFDSQYGKDIAWFFISKQNQIGLAEVVYKPIAIGTSGEAFNRIQAEFIRKDLPNLGFKITTQSCLIAKPKSRAQEILRIVIH